MRGTLFIALVTAFPLGAQATLSEIVSIPAGPFTMGSNEGPEDERPAHEVTLATYAIDRFPVTNAQFAEYLNSLGAAEPSGVYDFDDRDARIHRRADRWTAAAGFANHPVVEVTWNGAVQYCKWRGKRLPTEAEWEKAARGTDARRYPWGNQIPDHRRAQYESGYNATVPVDAFPAGASPYGAREMAGNVWEWVSSAYRAYPYRHDDGREDPKPGPVRGTRGGGHDSPASEITTTHRGRNVSRNPASGHHNIGFRCVR